MRVWDVSPGYLNAQSLLGEHAEVHAVHSILRHGLAGYAAHPEVLRWKGRLAALGRRHAWLRAEMTLRGFSHGSPLPRAGSPDGGPTAYVLDPADQLRLLRRKYRGRAPGRIPLPRDARELWRQHELSILARGREIWTALDRRVRRGTPMDDLAIRLVEALRRPADPDAARAAVRLLRGLDAAEALRQTALGDPGLGRSGMTFRPPAGSSA